MARPKKYAPREDIKSRSFQCLLYEDDSIDDALKHIMESWSRYYLIRHDSDVWDEDSVDLWKSEHPGDVCPYSPGELKKIHWHCIGVSSPCRLGRASEKFGVSSNLVQQVKSLKDAVRYLIHLDNIDKYQYDSSLILTNDPCYTDFLKSELSVESKAKKIIDFINSDGFHTINSVSIFALNNDCWDEFRRGQHIFTALIFEHNNLLEVKK